MGKHTNPKICIREGCGRETLEYKICYTCRVERRKGKLRNKNNKEHDGVPEYLTGLKGCSK